MIKKRSGILLCYPLEQRRILDPKFGWSFPLICQPKLDGVRCRAICNGPDVTLLSSTCSIITSVPHINKELESLRLDIELDGELYWHGENFETINSIVSRTKNLHEDFPNITYSVFDKISDASQLARLAGLITILPHNNPRIKMIDIKMAASFQEIMKNYEEFLNLGYEGIIVREKSAPYVRRRSTFVLKFKPKKSDVYKITDVCQMIDKNNYLKPLLGSLICTSDEGTMFSVGSGMTESFRREAWKYPKSLLGRYCKISYQHMTSKGSPRFPIFVSILDENPEESPDIETGVL